MNEESKLKKKNLLDYTTRNICIFNLQKPQFCRTPAQGDLKKKISVMESELCTTVLRRNSALRGSTINREISKMQRNLIGTKKLLERNAEYQKAFRTILQALLKDFIENQAVKRQSNMHEKVGRPRTEEAQLELLNILASIASFGADEKRRTKMIRSYRTLDDLVNELLTLGFNLSRSATLFFISVLICNSEKKRRNYSTGIVI